MEIILVIITSLTTILSILIGIRLGQKLQVGEKVNILPKLDFIIHKAEESILDEEINKLNTIIDNFENYKGDSTGQKEVI